MSLGDFQYLLDSMPSLRVMTISPHLEAGTGYLRIQALVNRWAFFCGQCCCMHILLPDLLDAQSILNLITGASFLHLVMIVLLVKVRFLELWLLPAHSRGCTSHTSSTSPTSIIGMLLTSTLVCTCGRVSKLASESLGVGLYPVPMQCTYIVHILANIWQNSSRYYMYI